MSGRCVPPANGSLRIQASPGACSSSRTDATALGMAPRCTGMCSACITIRPPASNRAVEASRRSLMLAECAERTSTTPISSQAARRRADQHLEGDRVEPAHRSSTTASASAVARQPGGTTSVAPGSSNTAGPLQLGRAGPQRPARRPRSPNRTGARAAPLGAGRRGRRRGLGPRQGRRHPHGHQLELRVRRRRSRSAAVGGGEPLAQLLGRRARARPPPPSSKAWPA